MKKLAFLVMALTVCAPAMAQPDFNKLAEAIHRTENGSSLKAGGESYGIHTVHYRNTSEARQICLRTIKRQWKRQPGLKSLAKHYCPKNWSVWMHNVAFFYGEAI